MRTPYLSKKFEVSGKVPGLSRALEIAAWVFLPEGEAKGVWFCLPGGSYSKAYYHLEVPGYPKESYSFALFMARQDFIVVALDNLGTGESTPEVGETLFSTEMIVAANHEALRQLNYQLMTGTLHPDFPALSKSLPVFGIGHSWGGKLLQLQETDHCFDAIAVCGWSNLSISLAGSEARLAQAAGVQQEEERPEETVRRTASRQTPAESRLAMLPFFLAPDVPEPVVKADMAMVTTFPHGVLEEDPNPALMQPIAAKIRVPIFLCLAAVDVANDLEAEAAIYPSGLAFSYALPGSHHCHNFATTRELLWTMLDGWAKGILKYSLN